MCATPYICPHEPHQAELDLRFPALSTGAPKKLQPLPEDAHLLESLSASNQTSVGPDDDDDAKQARRLVDSTFRFCVSDCMGNVIKGLSRAAIKCEPPSCVLVVDC